MGRCVFNDNLYNTIRAELAGAEVIVVDLPVYYAGPNRSL